MHELSIVQSIIDTLHEQMKIHKLSRVESVGLRIGTLRRVEIESLSFSFDVLTQGSPLEGARLEVEEVPLAGRCVACGKSLALENWFDDCPFCGETEVELITGKELDIVAIEGG
jgi:hydrogenase nickel incorporation protein HypA/HybF